MRTKPALGFLACLAVGLSGCANSSQSHASGQKFQPSPLVQAKSTSTTSTNQDTASAGFQSTPKNQTQAANAQSSTTKDTQAKQPVATSTTDLPSGPNLTPTQTAKPSPGAMTTNSSSDGPLPTRRPANLPSSLPGVTSPGPDTTLPPIPTSNLPRLQDDRNGMATLRNTSPVAPYPQQSTAAAPTTIQVGSPGTDDLLPAPQAALAPLSGTSPGPAIYGTK